MNNNSRFFNKENIALFISSLLIISLAIVNPGGANDNHFEVIELIRLFGSFPKSQQCWQCYHPPLYHWLVANVWKLFNIEATQFKYISSQLLNVVFGIGTVLVIKKSIYSTKLDSKVKFLSLLFIAFNPRLIAISAQATNDALIMFLGTLNIYFLIRLSEKISVQNSLGLIVSVVLASMSKLNFGVLFIADILTLLILTFLNRNFSFSLRKGYLGSLFIAILLCFTAMLFFNGYYKNLKNEGKILTYNTPVSEIPHLYKRPGIYIPGIQSIVHGYFTFHIIDLIKNPKINKNPAVHLKNMTSHFSQL